MNVSSYVGVLYFLAVVVMAVGIGSPDWLKRESSRALPPADEALLRERYSLWEYCVRVGGTGIINGLELPLREECGAIESDCKATKVSGSQAIFNDDGVVVQDCDRFNAVRGSAIVSTLLAIVCIVFNATHRPYTAVLTGFLSTVAATVTLAGTAEEGTSSCDTPRDGFSDATCSLEWSFDVFTAGYALLAVALVTQMVCVRRVHNKASDY